MVCALRFNFLDRQEGSVMLSVTIDQLCNLCTYGSFSQVLAPCWSGQAYQHVCIP